MTIGVLVSGLYDEYSRGICEGINYHAEQDGVNMVIIPGSYLEYDLNYAYAGIKGYQYNSSFFFGKKAGFDGLIIEMGSVGMYATDEFKAKFAAHFKDIPRVYISYEEEGTCNVSIDSAVGLQDALEYLYKQGNRKFVMMGGPAENVDAITRKNIFLKFLEKYQLPYTDKSYYDGDFVMDCSPQINQLLAENPDAEAVVCANDILARNVCDCLEQCGLAAGVDVSVLGYDDSVEACKKRPSLSSVRADFVKLGIESYKALRRVIDGEAVGNIGIPTKFIKRDSFVSKQKKDAGAEAGLDNYNFEDLTKKNVVFMDSPEITRIREQFDKLFAELNDVEGLVDREPEVMSFLDSFSQELNRLDYLKYIDADLCRQMLNQRYEIQMEQKPSPRAAVLLTRIYMQLYYSMTASLRHYYETEFANEVSKHSIQYFRQDVFSFEHGDDLGYKQLLEKSYNFGVQNALIYLYEEPRFMFQNEDFEIPEYLLLKAVMKDGKAKQISAAEQSIHQSRLLNNRHAVLAPNKPMMLFPLYCNEMVYGTILCDYSFEDFTTSGMFVAQMSSAVKMIATLRSNDTILSEYEETLQVLKSNNIELDKLSKSDYLTGLVNRRGFLTRAEEMLRTCRERGQPMMLVYVDMNNLKIINDKYGHNEGDYALQQIAGILKETVKDIGIAGRIGGDEFACALSYDRQMTEQEFIAELYHKFDLFNQESEKDYIVSICAGVSVIAPVDETTLERALALADERLYKEKKNRSKNIFKAALPASEAG